VSDARHVLVALLADEFGAGVEEDEHGGGRLTAHGALRAVEYVLDRDDIRKDSLDDELDRFVAHWDYRRDHHNPWQEICRADAIARLVKLQREPLLSAGPGYTPTRLTAAHDKVDAFLYCFGSDTRFFTNGAFRITEAAMDTGVVLLSRSLAGIWWHAEGIRGIAL